MVLIIALAAAFFIIIGIALLIILGKQEKKFGILNAERVYSDTESSPGETLFAKTTNLVGKPDYLIKENGQIIPVEVKTGKTPAEPYQNHVMQLMAYCLLVEENYGAPPPGGYLKYPDKEFKIKYTDQAREAVKDFVEEILTKIESNEEPHCSHPEHNTE